MPGDVFSSLGSVLGLTNGASGLFPPLQNLTSQSFNWTLPNRILDPAMYISLYFRGLIAERVLYERMREHGFSEKSTGQILDLSIPLLAPLEIITLYRRGLLTLEDFQFRMKDHGYSDERIAEILKVSEYFPTPQDLILFAVREVYTPESVTEYQMDEDLPSEFITEASKAGVTEEQAKNYWRAHWNLPSLTQVTEMLHRRIITSEDYSKFLRTADYSPFWRPKMEAVSYQPLTRVDVRRMYEIGVVDRQKVYDNFRDLGYNDENAELMTQFTTIYDAPETKGLTKDNLIKSFKRDIITLHELIELLSSIGYQNPMLSYWIDVAQYEKTQEKVQPQIDAIYENYLGGSDDIDSLRNRLYQLDLPTNYIEKLFNDAIIKKAAKRKAPSVETLVGWLQKQIIKQDYFHRKMKMLGYSDEDIVNYLTEIGQKVDTSTRKYLRSNQYQSWLKDGIITDDYFTKIMKEQGYSTADIQSLIIEARIKNESEG